MDLNVFRVLLSLEYSKVDAFRAFQFYLGLLKRFMKKFGVLLTQTFVGLVLEIGVRALGLGEVVVKRKVLNLE